MHRFLVNLESGGFLNSSSHGTFHLGIACFAVGQAALGHLDIRRLSLPYLQELNQRTRETIHLTIRHDLTAVYVEKLDSPEPVRIYSRIGAAVPLHCTAVGKVMLAYMSLEDQAAMLTKLDLKRATQNTGAPEPLTAGSAKRVRLGPGRKRSAHPLRGCAHLGSHRRGQRQPEHYRPGGPDADGPNAATRAVGATGGAEDFPRTWVSNCSGAER